MATRQSSFYAREHGARHGLMIGAASLASYLPARRAYDLEDRLVQFAIGIVRLTAELPNNFQSKHISTQILRSGTAAAPNYAEARAAENGADFIHKLKIALKELNETAVWLRILKGSFSVRTGTMAQLVAENTELCRILVASIQTARRNTRMKIEN